MKRKISKLGGSATTRVYQQGVRISELLETIYLLDSSGETRNAIDQLLDYVDGLLIDAEFSECDEVLKKVDVRRCSDPILVSFLGITKAASTRLSFRSVFYHRALSQVTLHRGVEGANNLLAKYR